MTGDGVVDGEAVRKAHTAGEEFGVLFKSKEVLVVDKPPDVRIDGDHEVTVEKWVAAEHGEMLVGDGRKLRFCHQLDYATSGVLCLAFKKQMAARISHCFQSRTSKKLYLALVHGHPSTSTLHKFNQPIADDPTDPTGFKMCVGQTPTSLKRPLDTPNPPMGKPSLTYCRVLHHGVFPTNPDLKISLVVLAPCTGRRHQLRVHCKEWGHPIVGDICYNPSDKDHALPRMMLHAWKLFLPVDCADTEKVSSRDLSRQKAERRSQKSQYMKSVKVDEDKENERKAEEAMEYLTASVLNANRSPSFGFAVTEGESLEIWTGNRLEKFIKILE
eukprot:TRINITY_DN7179_c0_g1_i1.p1 TRINITY_DN7179_c0_g1~~TRINITY_DN7179_c0_g1_i1.p1  ORF type:complete len:329 (+),score=56.63 TRINITY_DN7179_c0_g1_i1:906-1892(+)